LLALILQLALASSTAAQDDAPGRDRLALPALDGEPLTTADLAQGTTLLVVWASWSPRCRDIGARIDRLAETWSNDARVASVVFQERPETIREAVAQSGPAAPVYLDLSGDFSKRHAVITLPMLLIFRDGELAFRGKLSANPDPVIERVLAGG
jgi:thiol-disulfide isomerase/thioredoxin